MAVNQDVANAWSLVFSAARLAKLSADEHQSVFRAAQTLEQALGLMAAPAETPAPSVTEQAPA